MAIDSTNRKNLVNPRQITEYILLISQDEKIPPLLKRRAAFKAQISTSANDKILTIVRILKGNHINAAKENKS